MKRTNCSTAPHLDMPLFADIFADAVQRVRAARCADNSSSLRAGRIRCAGMAGAPAAACVHACHAPARVHPASPYRERQRVFGTADVIVVGFGGGDLLGLVENAIPETRTYGNASQTSRR